MEQSASQHLPQIVALITGANKGIGFEIAKQLGLKGVHVILGARDGSNGEMAAEELRDFGVSASAVVLDVTRKESVVGAAESIDKEFGRLDVLVNNAGIAVDHHTPPEEVTHDQLVRTYETNVFGVVAVTNAMLPLLRKSKSGRIVNQSAELASLSLPQMEPPMVFLNWLAYNSSKAALNSVTVEYAKALRETPIRVNAVSPGRVSSDLNGHAGGKSTAEGAEVAVFVAMLPPDSPTGVFWNETGQIAW